ncbi:MAG: ShlB/FhaC/HecB family hemolysin secretion/activation protein [Leptolyngbya sp. SIO4C5]|nr:ShlB/FhaC/HecB family hemolysin secretion/activation protein [Leptolyngbya sp. SIO4C5]
MTGKPPVLKALGLLLLLPQVAYGAVPVEAELGIENIEDEAVWPGEGEGDRKAGGDKDEQRDAGLMAQVPPDRTIVPLEDLPSEEDPEFERPEPLPAPEELLPFTQPIPETPTPVPDRVPENIVVERFEFVGNTAFTAEELQAVTEPFTNRPLGFNELFQVRSAITELYAREGYVTSAAIIPPQVLSAGVVTIQVVEGTLENIRIAGNDRLKPGYVRSRIEQYTAPPLDVDRLLEGLQLLQLDPLIRRVSAELAAGTQPGTSLLTLTIDEADPRVLNFELNNQRSPSVGSFQQILEFADNNFTGLGDRAQLRLSHSEGSRALRLGYRSFINPQNGTLDFNAGISVGKVVEGRFELLDINSRAFFIETTWRQPLLRTPTEEFAVGLTFSRQQTESVFLGNLFGDSIAFPAVGSNDAGITAVSALRFFQEWNQQGDREVLALRSQFNWGLDVFGATVSEREPDASFLSWQGQAQWVRLVAPETLLLLKADVQLATESLVPLEQFGLGGQLSVRGYRQDYLLTDNGILASAELRLPLYRTPTNDRLLQIVPFLDLGLGWNSAQDTPSSNVLASTGVGLLWQQANLFARLDVGLPLISLPSLGDSLQDEGIYFSIRYDLF